MRKAICLACAVVMFMALTGVASAGNRIGAGYAFMEDVNALCLTGELDLTDRLGFGFDYTGWDPSVTEVFGKLSLNGLGLAGVGVFGGVKLISGETDTNTFKVGIFAEQAVSPEIALYGRAGMAFQSSVSESWVEALGGLRATVMSPFWVSGEAMYSGGTGPDGGTTFRVLVGIDF